MPHLDPRSLALMACLMAVVMGFLLLGLRRNYPSTIHGLLLWGLAPLVCAVAAALYNMDRLITEPAAAMTGNVLLHTGFAMLLFGSQRFYGLRVTWAWWLGVMLLCHAALAYWLWVQPDYRLRVMLFTAVAASLAIAHARLLTTQSQAFAPRFTAAVLLFQAAVLLARAGAAWWVDAPQANRFTPSQFQSTYIAVYSFSVLLVCIGVQLMASERMREEYEYLATHDGLTGALTRRALLASVQEELLHCQRQGQSMALMMLDIDHFKAINDQHGHLVGDRVLVEFSSTLHEHLRSSDRLGRYGGEEFVLLMPGVTAQEAVAAAQRLREAVERGSVPLGEGAPLPGCTVSIGVAAARAGSAIADESFDTLAGRADAALYRAKSLGRNRVELAEPA